MIPSTLILATSNTHKVQELQRIISANGLDVTIVPVTDVWPEYHVEETGQTFEESAFLKALAVHEHTGAAVLADDSGLEVDALGGAPGVYSARYAGENATDADNRALLLQTLSGTATRTAQFRCVLCYVDAQRTLFDEGIVRGSLLDAERGEHGFGYDPLFVPDDASASFAEMAPDEKHARSHRGRATAGLIAQLRSLAEDSGHAVVDDALPMTDALIMVSVAAVTQHTDQLRSTIRHTVRTASDALLLYEALLQSYLFAGFPAALDSLVILDEECRAILGSVDWPEPEPFDVQLYTKRGESLCERIYEGVYERMMQRLGRITPDLAQWMIVEGYGKTLARTALPIVQRELCIVAMLAALGREQQLYSHVRGALLVGASTRELHACADIVYEQCGAQAGARLESVIDAVMKDRT